MAEKAVTIDELKALVGKEEKTEVIEVEKRMIRMVAEAIGDPNPLWSDEAYAKKCGYQGLVAPPGFLITAMVSGGRVDVPMPYKRMLAGGGEWEFYSPIVSGDVITCTCKLGDVYEREGKGGKMAFFVFETVHKNQRDELVAKSRTTLISLD